MSWKRYLWICLALYLGSRALSGQPPPGTLLWSHEVGDAINSSPALAPDGTLYIGTSLAIYAVTNSATTASNKWVLAPSGVNGSITIGSDGTLYFGGGGFSAVRPDGTQKWLLILTNAIYKSTPAIGRDGTIYFAASGRLYAVTPLGAVKWQLAVDDSSTPSRTMSPGIGPDGTIYVGGFYNANFHAANPDGSEKWATPVGTATVEAPAIAADGTIYLTLYGVRALAPNGTEIWRTGLQGNAPPIVGPGGAIYVPDTDLALNSLKPTGETNWRAVPFSVALRPTTPVVDASGTIYYCVSNALFALSPQGSVQWVFTSPYPPYGSHMYDTQTSPAIGPDGTIYCAFGSKLFALAGTNAVADSPWPMYHQNPRHTGKVEKPSLNKPQKRSDGGFQFELYGQLSNSYTFQTSTSLLSWCSLTSVLVTNVPMDVVDADATNFPSRFYRALTP